MRTFRRGKNGPGSSVTEKDAEASPTSVQVDQSEEFTPGAQDGVLKIEATTTVWTKRDIWIAYIL
jgi:hypothetical protein